MWYHYTAAIITSRIGVGQGSPTLLFVDVLISVMKREHREGAFLKLLLMLTDAVYDILAMVR